MWSKARPVGNAHALSTGRAGAPPGASSTCPQSLAGRSAPGPSPPLDAQRRPAVAAGGGIHGVEDAYRSSLATGLTRARSRSLTRFLAAAVLRLKRIDSLPVSRMWQ